MNAPLNPGENEFAKSYSDDGFWQKLARYAKSAGAEVVERALQLYYAAQDPATPGWARGVIFASLGYFVNPLDAISDLVPVVGYSDDLGVLALALATVMAYITPEIKEKARAKTKEWFG